MKLFESKHEYINKIDFSQYPAMVRVGFNTLITNLDYKIFTTHTAARGTGKTTFIVKSAIHLMNMMELGLVEMQPVNILVYNQNMIKYVKNMLTKEIENNFQYNGFDVHPSSFLIKTYNSNLIGLGPEPIILADEIPLEIMDTYVDNEQCFIGTGYTTI